MIYTIEELTRRIAPVAEKYNLRAVYLFASYARDEATEASDVDVLIDREGSAVKTAFDMGGVYSDLCDSIDKEVDLVTVQTLEQKSIRERTPWFIDNVRADMRKILCIGPVREKAGAAPSPIGVGCGPCSF